MRIIASGLIAALLVCSQAHAVTADELIAKNITAKGGIKAIEAISSLKSSGTIDFGGGAFQLSYGLTQVRPNLARSEASIQGLTAVQAYDGKEAWSISPFGGRRDPEKMSADDAREMIDSADIDGPLVNYKAKGSTVAYLGTEDVDGTLAHKIKLTQKDGDEFTYFLDPDYFLEIRVVSKRQLRGTDVESETDVGNYEKVNGVYLPFAIEVGPKGSSQKQKITIDKIEANVATDGASFSFPTTGGAK